MRPHQCLALGALALFCVAVPAADPLVVVQPELKVGDSWTYGVLDPLSRAEKHELVITVTAVSEGEIQASPDALFDRQLAVKRFNGVDYTPAEQNYVFPLEIGKRWSHSPSFSYRDCGMSTMKLEATVVGWETITVPAGTFRALRVDHKGRSSNACGSPTLTRKRWYVPELKAPVRIENFWQGAAFGGDTFVLKSWTVN